MAKMTETVLYYNPGRPETVKHVAMMKSVLVRMGVRIKNIGPEQVLEKVGYLAGMDGYEAAGSSAGAEGTGAEGTGAEGTGAEGTGAGPGELPVIPEEVMVLKQFSGQRLDMLLSGLRRAGVPRIALKAVLTEHNSDWTFYHLYQELKEEHETMTAGQQS
uniref:DUF3783 domain-containing protein n=1 Tax=Enterocloster clostridioformis TaxID=1531 RepID=UPI0026F09512|nr:DUF3783 domain-containing protein [Enterocloster clostridioformis]